MNKGGGIERLTRLFVRHFLGRELAELVIDQGEELLRGMGSSEGW